MRDLARFTAEHTLDPATRAITWVPRDGDDPVAVALAYLQRRLLVAAAAASGGRRQVETALGRPRDVLKGAWDGSECLQLHDIVALALTYDAPLQMSSDPVSLLPGPYQAWLDRVPGRPPSLRRPEVVKWADVAGHVARTVAIADSTSMGRFLRGPALLAAVAEGVAACGVPSDLVDLDPADPDRRLIYALGRGFGVTVGLLSDEPPTGTTELDAAIRSAAGVVAKEVLVLVVRPRAWERLTSLWVAVGDPKEGERVSLGAQLAHSAGAPTVVGDLPQDLSLLVAGSSMAGETHVLILGADK
jgi:hypothetical protein